MNVGRDTTIFTAIFRFTVNYFHRDNTVRVRHRIMIFRQFFSIFVPFDCWWWITTETAKKFARLPDLNDAWSKKESKVGRRFNSF